jgi:segregation and condensation protein B
MDNIKQIIESLLFVAEEPLTIERIRNIIAVVNQDEVRSALSELSDEYTTRGGGFYLREVAGGYQLRTRPEFTQWIKRLLQPKQQRLSKAALETLAIVAYKQPIIRSDIEYLRGVDCGGILRMLLERKLIRILGRKELPGRPMIYGTTRHFLEVFDLKDLTDLPSPKEIEELGKGPAEQAPQPMKAGNDKHGEAAQPTASDEMSSPETPVSD